MHICFITHEYPKPGFSHGGIGTFVKTIASKLVENGIDVSIVGINFTSNNEETTDSGVRIHRLKKNTIKGISWWLNYKQINSKISEIHRKNPIDIVETSELGLAFINKKKAIKYVIRLHGGHHFFSEAENRNINKWRGFQEKRAFSKADAFIAVSQYVKIHTEKYLSYNNKIIEVINYPINTELFKPLVTPIFENRIVFAGTVCEKKGIRQLIKAFPIVQASFPNATLEIYGRDWFFPDGSSYTEKLNKNELLQLGKAADAIHFHGAISYDKIPLAYAESAVCVFPSHMETQGLVALEAMAMEKTIVFTKLGPGIETISNFETGLLCDPLNPNEIAENIIWVLTNKEKSIQIGKKARSFVVNKYDLNNIFKKNIEFYNLILRK
jgi:glycosyltransferase involved in cell wall biosynthesis